MINFLHTNIPESILISIGPIHIFYYGLFIVTGILIGIFICLKLAEKYNIKKELIIDSAFWLITGGIIGGRIYHVFLEFPYYLENPIKIFKTWEGGLAIHGGIIAGIIISYFFAKKHKINLWMLSSIYVPALALAQTIGRWGNYFNQELFGKPTDLPWGIPILPENRIAEFYNHQYFHPTFLYESIGNFLIFITLMTIHYKSKSPLKHQYITISYLILYSILRFSLEFVRIDTTPLFLGLRFPQIASIIISLISVTLIINIVKKEKESKLL